MRNNKNNYQDTVLNYLCEEKSPFTLFLLNGVRMQGTLTGYDEHVLLMEIEGRMQMVFRQALSTIIPHYPTSIQQL